VHAQHLNQHHVHGDDDLHASPSLQPALILTGVFALVELAGGWLSGSLALMADAVHMVSDVAALGLAALAQRIALRPAHDGMTYGYGRVQVLAAQVNGLGLWFLAGWIAWVALERLASPPPVEGGLMLAVAVVGLIVNIVILRWLHGGHDINTRAAYWHVLGDLLGSVAAIVAGVVIVSTGWMPIDPLLSLLVVLILIWGGWRLVRETTLQLMEGAPQDADEAAIRASMLAVGGVSDVHHLHIWTLPSGEAALSAHIGVRDMNDWPAMLPELNRALEGVGLTHATLQPELTGGECPDGC